MTSKKKKKKNSAEIVRSLRICGKALHRPKAILYKQEQGSDPDRVIGVVMGSHGLHKILGGKGNCFAGQLGKKRSELGTPSDRQISEQEGLEEKAA